MRYSVAMQIDRTLDAEELLALNAIEHLTADNDDIKGRCYVQARTAATAIADACTSVGDSIRAVIGEGHITDCSARALDGR